MGLHAYAVTNLLAGLANADFTWSNAYAGTDKTLVNDGRMDKRVVIGSPVTTINLIIDLGSAKSVMGVALLNTNVVTGGATGCTVLIEGADNAGMSTNLVTAKSATTLATFNGLNAKDPQNKDHVLQFAAVSKRYWRITWAYTGTATDFSVGEIFFYASSITLQRKGIYGSGDAQRMYASELEFGSGETRGVFFGGPVRIKKLRWSDLASSELDDLRKMWWAGNGKSGKVLFINSYEAVSTAAAAAQQDCLYGRLSGMEALDYPEMDFSLFGIDDFHIRSLGREVGS